MDRLRAHVVATAVLTAALAALPLAMQKPTSAASTTGAARSSADTHPQARGAASASASAQPSTSGSASAQAVVSAATPVSTTAPNPAQTPSGALSVTPAPAPLTNPPFVLVPFPCADTRQVGPTAYTRWHGMIAFSVKQFYSPGCHAVYGYAYPWLQFRSLKAHYVLGLGMYDVAHDAIVGARTITGGLSGSDFWSAPFSPAAGSCTRGLAHVFFPDDETDTMTDKFCA